MSDSSSNIILIVIGIILLIVVIYYINKNNDQPMKEDFITELQQSGQMYDTCKDQNNYSPNQKNYNGQNKTLDGIIPKYDNFISDNQTSNNTISDIMNSPTYGSPIQSNCDKNEFVYKKKKFVKKTPEDLNDLFDINKMLPNEIEDDWFDTAPLMSTKQINNTQLIHPKVHMGTNTVQSTLKNATHDIRGDIPNPKLNVFLPWNNSTIEHDNNIKGLC